MDMIKLKCPQCNADLEIGNGIDTFFCTYCGCRLMLDGQNRHVLKAKTRLKELEHEEYKLRHESKEKDKEFQRETEREKSSNRMVLIGIGICLLVVLASILGYHALERKTEKEIAIEEIRLQSIVDTIHSLMVDGEFDQASALTEQIKWTYNKYTSHVDKWETIRTSLVQEIKQKRKTYLNDYGIPVPLGSSDAKGMSFTQVEETFSEAGFLNIQTVKLNEKPSLFTKAGVNDVKSISINGDSTFKSGTLFIPNSPIIISYYGLE